jgi:hypothetical protein
MKIRAQSKLLELELPRVGEKSGDNVTMEPLSLSVIVISIVTCKLLKTTPVVTLSPYYYTLVEMPHSNSAIFA